MPISGVQSRHATAEILSFYGFDSEVCHLLQIMSHKTRAYIINTDGLKGFLTRFSILKWLQRLYALGELESITGKQHIDLDSL